MKKYHFHILYISLICISLQLTNCATLDPVKTDESNIDTSENKDLEINKSNTTNNPYLLKETPITIRNGVHSMSVLSNGRFSLGTERNFEKLDLIYGHPNGAYSEGIWSSYITISVEGKNFKFDQLKNKEYESTEDTVVLTGLVPDYPIKVTLTLKPKGKDGFKFQLTAVNEGKNSLYIGFRLLLDTWAGRSDGVPFILPGLSQGIDSIYTHEVKFSPASSPSWETFDPDEPRSGFLRTSLLGDSLDPPNRVALVNWGLAFISDWEYEVDKENPVVGDSAVLSWWDPTLVASKEDKNASILFESNERTDGIFFVPTNNKGNGFLYLARENASGKLQKRNYTISVENGTFFSSWTNGKMEVSLSPGSYLYRMIPVTVSGFGKTKLNIQESIDGNLESHIFSVELATEIASTPAVWESGRKFPFRFVSEQSGRKLKGRILDGNQIKKLEIPLKENKQVGYSIYEAEVDINFEGEVISEIVEED
ncbi:MAG: hypothetical protein SH817_05955 [Leptospira sp.]|nr:hypothetical protein [Leptospira sp.]